MPPKRPTQQLTHFLALPLHTPTSLPPLHTTLRTLPPSLPTHLHPALRPPTTLHFTLCVLDLRDPIRLSTALSILRTLDIPLLWAIAQGPPAAGGQLQKDVRVTLKGLMATRDPGSTSVIYAPPVDETRALQRFGELVRSHFACLIGPPPTPPPTPPGATGPARQETVMPPLPRPLPRLLLHATVFNTVYVPGRSRRDRQRVEIDARALIEAFGEMVWMENIRVEELVLCRMGAKEVEGVERYVAEGTVGMP
ncbi:hypothetical protein GMDG_03256 [Pseudogymnoascus destructans 20631-21]|uniref:A-kinase anchor protein 7-like phosphoesterase domain-containing protein n=2 Tax=Pseudogymnoascus destructans TaxID=655981 RepID=L8G948_PSED2|nr:hypothetical protein GMDG_03256 [Pseudogymnoascus destructans 20631-21]